MKSIYFMSYSELSAMRLRLLAMKSLSGVDSETYKRHEFLRGFYEQHKNEDILTSDNLHRYLDFVCNDMDYCKKYFQWSDEKCKLVEDLNNLCELSQLDAEYLLSMVKKESGDEG